MRKLVESRPAFGWRFEQIQPVLLNATFREPDVTGTIGKRYAV